MSDRNFQHEPDDELLSAYLDDELAPEQSAAVEARLASDPDAQQILHQLRSVSQAVQRLPLETVGRDLSEQVLRRAESLKPGKSTRTEDTVPAPGAVMPKVTIFQSRRSWIWASLALAAGLLIMVVQSGEENQRNVATVAQRNGGKIAGANQEQSLGRAGNEPAPAAAADPSMIAGQAETASSPAPPGASPPASVATPQPPLLADGRPTEESRESDKFAVNRPRADSAPLPASAPIAPASNLPLRDVPSDEDIRAGRIAAAGPPSPPPVSRAADEASISAVARRAPAPASVALDMKDEAGLSRGKGGESAPAAAPGALESTLDRKLELREAQESPLVIVHVVAKSAAIQSKSLDKLLLKYGITVEPSSDTQEGAAVDERRVGKSAGAELLAVKSLDKPAGGDIVADIVLVDAPKPTILKCLAGLKNDEANYVGVDVQAPIEPLDRAGAGVVSGNIGPSDLSQYNWGLVSPQQKELFRDAYRYKAAADSEKAKKDAEPGDRIEIASERKEKATEGKPSEPTELGVKVQSVDDLVRARRLSRSDIERHDASKPAMRGGAAGATISEGAVEMRRAQTAGKALAALAPENMQVLFVLSPDSTAATGAPAEKSAK